MIDQELEQSIINSNPFAIKFVDQQHIWGESFPDVSEINAHISDAVFSAIEKVNVAEIPSIGIIILGEKGLGKTQVISRIRHTIQSSKTAFFIYMGDYGDLDAIKPEFRKILVIGMKREGSEGVMQWQELAAQMFFEAKGDRPCTTKELAEGRFQNAFSRNPKLIDQWTDIICRKKLEITNPYIVKAILWTLTPSHASYAIAWLTGQEISSAKADELGLPNNSSLKQDNETFSTICEILDLIGLYKTLIFCFDELDDPGLSARGFTRAQSVLGFAKDLRNRINKCVILAAMYPQTLRDEIKLAQSSGASYDRTADSILELEYLNPDTTVALVLRWLEKSANKQNFVPPYPLYPFKESELREIGKEKPTARMVLKWCFDNWTASVLSNIDPTTVEPNNGDLHDSNENIEEKIKPLEPIVDRSVDVAFQNEFAAVKDSISDLMEDNAAISDALMYGFFSLMGETLENVEITGVDWIDQVVNKADQGYLHLRIWGVENTKVSRIGVAVVQESAGKFIGAALKRLIDYDKFSFTRGCLVRSKTINKGSAVPRNCVKKLINEQGGEWVLLQENDLIPLLTISMVFANQEEYELTDEQIYEYIDQQELTINNPLLLEILSDPSGREPDGLIDEDMPISIPKASAGRESDQETAFTP